MKNKRGYFLENNQNMSNLVLLISILSLFLTFSFLFFFESPKASTWDQVDFALALNRFDLLAMQPHFPGYPYFILGGTIFHQLITNEAKSLATFNVVLLITAVFPIFKLLHKYLKIVPSIFGVALIISSVYPLIITTQPMSEGSAIAVLWWYLWSIQVAKKSDKFAIIPLFLFSILLGIRLSYLPFGIGILLLWWRDIRKKNYLRLALLLCAAILFQFIWVLALVHSEGGMKSFLKLAFSFTSGHFDDWGGAVTSTKGSIIARFFHLIFYNYFWTGICAQSVILLVLWCLLFLIFISTLAFGKTDKIEIWMGIQGGCYFLWAFLAQNVDKPRHTLPLIAISLFYLITKLLKKKSNLIFILMVICLFGQQFIGFKVLKQQATNLPAVYQMANYSKHLETNAVLYTWEESRIFDYLHAPFIHKPIFTYDYFLQDKMDYEHGTIYLTDHVVKGFEMQGKNVKKHIEKVAEFHSNQIFDPVYNDMILYKWKK